jgi:hypothetical protein
MHADYRCDCHPALGSFALKIIGYEVLLGLGVVLATIVDSNSESEQVFHHPSLSVPRN